MEFTQYKCPVCNKSFVSGDDVVVCPECGAPHHRECWEKLGCCFYEDRHSEGFSFDAKAENGAPTEDGQQAESKNVCPACGHQNAEGTFYCGRCGAPLGSNQSRQNPNGAQNGQGMPFDFGAAQGIAFDPLAGMNGEDELCDGIKVSEMAKFVGKNTPYFLIYFKKIVSTGRSRFNFASLLMPGIYLIYRKMTLPGILVTLFYNAIVVLSSLLNVYLSAFLDESGSIVSGADVSVYGLLLIALMLTTSANYALRVLCGLFTNRFYFGHCKKKIKKIKEDNPENVSERLEREGGVNLGFAISLGVATIIISYVCSFMMLKSGALF